MTIRFPQVRRESRKEVKRRLALPRRRRRNAKSVAQRHGATRAAGMARAVPMGGVAAEAAGAAVAAGAVVAALDRARVAEVGVAAAAAAAEAAEAVAAAAVAAVAAVARERQSSRRKRKGAEATSREGVHVDGVQLGASRPARGRAAKQQTHCALHAMGSTRACRVHRCALPSCPRRRGRKVAGRRRRSWGLVLTIRGVLTAPRA